MWPEIRTGHFHTYQNCCILKWGFSIHVLKDARCYWSLTKWENEAHLNTIITFLCVNIYVWHIPLTHWGRVTHICVSDLTSIGSDNCLSPGRRQAIIKTNAGILLIRPLRTNFSEFLVEILIFSFKKIAFESVVCEKAAILSRPQWVKSLEEYAS